MAQNDVSETTENSSSGNKNTTFSHSRPIKLKYYAWVVALIWTGVLSIALVWTITDQREKTYEIAVAKARATYNKDSKPEWVRGL